MDIFRQCKICFNMYCMYIQSSTNIINIKGLKSSEYRDLYKAFLFEYIDQGVGINKSISQRWNLLEISTGRSKFLNIVILN